MTTEFYKNVSQLVLAADFRWFHENVYNFIKNLSSLCLFLIFFPGASSTPKKSPYHRHLPSQATRVWNVGPADPGMPRGAQCLHPPPQKKEFGRDRRNPFINYQVPPPDFQTFCWHWNASILYCYLPYRKLLLVDKFQSELRWNKKYKLLCSFFSYDYVWSSFYVLLLFMDMFEMTPLIE